MFVIYAQAETAPLSEIFDHDINRMCNAVCTSDDCERWVRDVTLG